MKTITFTNFARDLGINPLTGEACAFSQRVLCDVNERGAALVRDWLGLPFDAKLGENWNSTVGIHPSVGSVMLDRACFGPLARHAMLLEGHQYLYYRDDASTEITVFNDIDVTTNSGLQGLLDGTSNWLLGDGQRLQRNPRPRASVVGVESQPFVGSRNVHAFTGRVA